MKNPRKPMRAHKISMTKAGLDWHTWLVVEEDNTSIKLISKKSGIRKVISK